MKNFIVFKTLLIFFSASLLLCSCTVSKVYKNHGDEDQIVEKLISNSTYFQENFGRFEKDKIREAIVELYRMQDNTKYSEPASKALNAARSGSPEEAKSLFVTIINLYKSAGYNKIKISDMCACLASLYFLSDLEECLKIYEEAALNNPSKVAFSELLGFYYYNSLDDLEKGTLFYSKVFESADPVKDKYYLGEASLGSGNIEVYNKNYDKAEKYFRDALDYFAAINNKKKLALTYSDLGWMFKRKKDYEEACINYQRSLKIYKEINYEYSAAKKMSNLGNIYDILENYDKAKSYYFEALTVFEKRGNKKRMANTYSSLGDIFKYQNDLNMAAVYYMKSLELETKMDRKWGMAYDLCSIGKLLTEGELYLYAEDFHFESLNLYKEIGDLEGVAQQYRYLGPLKAKQGDMPTAKAFLKKSIEIYTQLEDKNMVKRVNRILKNIDNGLKT